MYFQELNNQHTNHPPSDTDLTCKSAIIFLCLRERDLLRTHSEHTALLEVNRLLIPGFMDTYMYSLFR